jgi:tRNA dimethylallyltransferase
LEKVMVPTGQKDWQGPDGRWVVFIVGPTASGKSEVALEIAHALRSDIISADSRQVYRGLDIGTAKPAPRERSFVRHHLIDIVDPDQDFSAGHYKQLAEGVIEGLHREGKIPVVVGGTGLYVRVLRGGLCKGPGANWELRRRLQKEEEELGEGTLHRRLAQVDPESALRIHPRDRVKVIRALEVYTQVGRPLVQFHREHGFREGRYQVLLFGLKRERDDLRQRIEERVDEMIRRGLVEEVRGLLERGYHEGLSAMQGLGYRQVVCFLKGEISLEEMIRVLKRDTHRYGKRQMTWFKREENIHWFFMKRGSTSSEVVTEMLEEIKMTTHGGDHGVKIAERSAAC